ncbi:Protein of unknown function [Lactobacillus delbrueckii subsp. bulgaricus]|nr:Protein of unknown function [Lactobacillus delbrueckii subsp. bulgaricus]CDR74402.1 Protein of unknown function [Lactobacillus delbrueckii subsp. bulgaricus]
MKLSKTLSLGATVLASAIAVLLHPAARRP